MQKQNANSFSTRIGILEQGKCVRVAIVRALSGSNCLAELHLGLQPLLGAVSKLRLLTQLFLWAGLCVLKLALLLAVSAQP